MKLLHYCLALLLSLAAISVGICQTQSRTEPSDSVTLEGFSLECGLVSVVDGSAALVSSSKVVRPLKFKEKLVRGDTIQTSSTGRVEVLLNPGYYLRLDRNTALEVVDLSHNNLRLKLWQGSALLEIASNEMPITIPAMEWRMQLSNEFVTIQTPSEHYHTTADPHGWSAILFQFYLVHNSGIQCGPMSDEL